MLATALEKHNQGIEKKGRKKAQIEITERLLENNFSIDFIVKVTGLSKSQVFELKNQKQVE